MKIFSHSLPVRARQLLKAPYTERYVRCCERTAVNHRLLLDRKGEYADIVKRII